MISMLKENAVTIFIEPIKFDQNDEVNTGIENYDVYQNNKAKFHVVGYGSPEARQLHQFISTLPKSINLVTIAMIYYKRWAIEKAFNNSKSDATERKVWSPNLNALNSQMRFTAMAYNIMRICSFTIRFIQNSVITGRSLMAIMSSLVGQLKQWAVF